MRNRDNVVIVFASVAILIIAAFFVFYRHTVTVEIRDRYWLWQLSVKYDVDTWTIETECTGTGNARTCTTDTVRHTTTYTRCSSDTSGKSLPPLRPQIPCAMWSGDYIRETVTYHIVDSQDRTFPVEMWDWLEPGVTRLVQVNVLGNVTGKGSE